MVNGVEGRCSRVWLPVWRERVQCQPRLGLRWVCTLVRDRGGGCVGESGDSERVFITQEACGCHIVGSGACGLQSGSLPSLG